MIIPSGVILLWFGAIIDIPAGWVICDGNNGTPNLQDRFLVGAGDTYNPDNTGGAVNHNHDFTGDGHSHTFGGGVGIAGGIDVSSNTSADPAAGTTDNGSSLPPYHALAHIMKT